MKIWVSDWLERKKAYRHKLQQNIAKLQLPMDNYWPNIIKMSLEECRSELQEVESDIRYLEAGGWDELDESLEDGKRETRDIGFVTSDKPSPQMWKGSFR